MFSQIEKNLSPAENIEFIRSNYFSKETYELMLINLKSIEVSDRREEEKDQKNDRLNVILNNLLSYAQKGITHFELMKLYNVDYRKTVQDKKDSIKASLKTSKKANSKGSAEINSEMLLEVSDRNRGMPENSLPTNKKVKSLVENESDNELDTSYFSGRIDSLLRVAFWANKAEKLRYDNYFGKNGLNSKANNFKASKEDEAIAMLYKKLLYDIKHECVRQLIIALITDERATVNGNWGIDADENGKRIFRYMSDQERMVYSFHIPDHIYAKMFSKEIRSKIDSGEYSIHRISNHDIIEYMTNDTLSNKQLVELTGVNVSKKEIVNAALDRAKENYQTNQTQQLNRLVVGLVSNPNTMQNRNWGIDKNNDGQYVFRYASEKEKSVYRINIPEDVKEGLSTDTKEKIESGTYSLRNSKFLSQQIILNTYYKVDGELTQNALEQERNNIVKSALSTYITNRPDRYVIMMTQKMRNELNSEQPEEYIHSDTTAEAEGVRNLRNKVIEAIIKNNGVIVTQYGENLDLHGTVATLQNYFDNDFENDKTYKGIRPKAGEKIKIVRKPISAGNTILGEYLVIDNGKLVGFKDNSTGKTVEINANLNKGERSSVSVLASLGFKVPYMITEYADAIVSGKRSDNSNEKSTDEIDRALDPFDGCTLAREVPTERLFEYAEATDEKTGKYLMESSLSFEQLEQFGLTEIALKRERDIGLALQVLSEHSFITKDKDNIDRRVAVIPQMLYNGSFVAYTLGYDCYVSTSARESAEGRDESKSTFGITLNPASKSRDGKMLQIPEESINSLYSDLPILNDEGNGRVTKGKIFVNPLRTMAILGGKKNQSLYVNMPNEQLYTTIASHLQPDRMQKQKVEKETERWCDNIVRAREKQLAENQKNIVELQKENQGHDSKENNQEKKGENR